MQYHLTKHGNEWRLQEAGSDAAIFTADTKAEAIDKLRDYMEDRDGSVVIHGVDGKFQERRTYPVERQVVDSGPRVTSWSIIGVVAVAAVTAAAVVSYYYRDRLPVDRLRLPRR